MKYLLIIISGLIFSSSSVIHQDRILKIDDNGNIIGLPKEYGPSKFDLNRKYLRIKDHEIVIPKCISYYFDIYERPKLRLSASWYHSKNIMPYYLNFDISQRDEKHGYKMLVNLETLELIYIQISNTQGNSTYSHQIKVDNVCLDEHKKAIKVLKE